MDAQGQVRSGESDPLQNILLLQSEGWCEILAEASESPDGEDVPILGIGDPAAPIEDTGDPLLWPVTVCALVPEEVCDPPLHREDRLRILRCHDPQKSPGCVHDTAALLISVILHPLRCILSIVATREILTPSAVRILLREQVGDGFLDRSGSLRILCQRKHPKKIFMKT